MSDGSLRVSRRGRELTPGGGFDVLEDDFRKRIAIGGERGLQGLDLRSESESLAPQLDGPVEVRHLHGKPVLSRGVRELCAVILQCPAQLSLAAIGAGTEIAALRQFARDVVSGGLHGARQLRNRGPRHEAVADDDAGSARALRAAIERGKSGLESGDGAPAFILRVHQPEALGLVVTDALQQRLHLRGFLGRVDFLHLARRVRQAFRRHDRRPTVVRCIGAQVREHGAIVSRHAVAEVAHAARQRLELLLHLLEVERRIASAAQRHDTGGRECADHDPEPEHQPHDDRHAVQAGCRYLRFFRRHQGHLEFSCGPIHGLNCTDTAARPFGRVNTGGQDLDSGHNLLRRPGSEQGVSLSPGRLGGRRRPRVYPPAQLPRSRHFATAIEMRIDSVSMACWALQRRPATRRPRRLRLASHAGDGPCPRQVARRRLGRRARSVSRGPPSGRGGSSGNGASAVMPATIMRRISASAAASVSIGVYACRRFSTSAQVRWYRSLGAGLFPGLAVLAVDHRIREIELLRPMAQRVRRRDQVIVRAAGPPPAASPAGRRCTFMSRTKCRHWPHTSLSNTSFGRLNVSTKSSMPGPETELTPASAASSALLNVSPPACASRTCRR